MRHLLARYLNSIALFGLPVAALAILGGACAATGAADKTATPTNDDPVSPAAQTQPPPLPVSAVAVLTLQFSGLRPLSSGHYEGWALFESEQVSTGTFRVGPDGALTGLNGTAIAAFPLARDIAEARQISITIEPEADRDAAPSGIVILNGALVGGRARLAFPVPLEGLAGGFVLATPTDGEAAEVAGAWFTNGTRNRATLELPELRAGWVYEGWVGFQGLAFSTGRFARPQGPDGAAPFSGPEAGYAFPGEDFVAKLPPTVRAPVNLADGTSTLAITIEPDLGGQDPSGIGPFWLLPLRREIGRDTPTGVQQRLDLDLSVVPSGVALVG